MSQPKTIFLLWSGSILGTAILFAAGVSPQDAVSNVAAWLKLFGIDKPPGLLTSPSADTFGLWIGGSIAVISGFFLVRNYWQKRFISLREGALLAYEKTQGSLAAGMAEGMPGGPLGWYATALVGQPQREHIPVYATKPPSRKRIVIPSEELPRGIISDEGRSFKYWGQNEPKYVDLQIKRSYMKKRIKEIRTWG
jgi:hypothetical protein